MVTIQEILNNSKQFLLELHLEDKDPLMLALFGSAVCACLCFLLVMNGRAKEHKIRKEVQTYLGTNNDRSFLSAAQLEKLLKRLEVSEQRIAGLEHDMTVLIEHLRTNIQPVKNGRERIASVR